MALGHVEGGTGFSGESKTGSEESKPPERFCNYIVMMSSIWEFEPSTFEAYMAEAEYMASSQASCESLWLRKMLVGLFGL